MNQFMSDIRQNIQQSMLDSRSALRSFMQMKLNNLNTSGVVNITDEMIQLTVNPTATINLFTFLGGNNSSLQITLQKVTYDYHNCVLVVDTRGYGSQTIISNVLEVQNTDLSLSVNLQNVSTLNVTYSGDWIIDATTISVQAVYYHSSEVIEFTAEVSSFSLNLQSLASDVVGISLPTAVSGTLSVSEFVISGNATASLDVQLYIKATIGSTSVYVIYQKDAESTAKRAVAVEISNIQFSTILQDTTGLDITGIPYFGSTTANIGVTIANTRINAIPNNFFPTNSLLSKIGRRIKENVTAVMLFGFSPIAIKLCYCNGFPSFQPVIPGGISISDLLSALPNLNIDSVPLPPGISGFPQLRIESFGIDVQLGVITINIDYPNTLRFFYDLLRIDNPLPTLNVSGLDVQLNIFGDLSISGVDLSTAISLNTALNDYCLAASVDVLPITSLISQLILDILPAELNSIQDSLPFFSFSINNARLDYCLSPSSRQIQLAGTPVISGYSTVDMASVIIRQGTRTLLVQGFEVGSVNLAALLRTITGSNFNNIALLNQELDVAILISPRTLPNVRLTGSQLSQFSVTRGVSVQASMQFPNDCSSDAFCAVAQSLLGSNAQLSLQGTIASTTSWSLLAGVSDINLGSGITMSQAGVEIRGGALNSVGIIGIVDLSDPDITLAARVFLSTSGVVLEMAMSGCWENAFGANWLDICSLHSSVAMIPGAALTGLALGAEVHIGDGTCGAPINATGYFGVDAITPTQNYYYVNIPGSTTVSTILSALCVNLALPAPIAQSGFPHGFLSSFSLVGVELPHVPLSIPIGFRLNGTMNILGLQGSADVIIGLPNGIDFNVSLPPIRVGGELLQMFAPGSDFSHGPTLTVDIDLVPSSSVDIQLQTHVRVLGISVDTAVAINDTHYRFDIQGDMLGLFAAQLVIVAPYGNIVDASYRVKGSFTNNLYANIENEITSVLQGAAQEASQELNITQAGLNSARDTLNNANSALDRGRQEVNDAQSAFDNAQRDVNNLRNRIDSVCSIRSCGTGKDIMTHVTVLCQ